MVFIVSLEFFLFFASIIVVAGLAILLTVLAVSLWVAISTLSVTFSRLAMSLLISTGTLFAFDLKIFENGFLNFLIRFAIVYGIIWLASFIPRLEPAIGTLCTFFVSLLTTMLTMGFAFTFIDLFTKPETASTNTWWFYLLTSIIITIATAINWLRDISRIKEKSSSSTLLSKPIFVRIGRVIASIIYGFILFMIVGISLNTTFTKAEWLQFILLFAFSGLAYVADLFLFDRVPPKHKVESGN